MAKRTPRAPGARDRWLDAEALKEVPLAEVLERYGLLEDMERRGPGWSGPSPFSNGGTLSANEGKNVWNDSWGRPEIDGRVVPGNVIGLVQALEGVPFRRALEILDERFAAKARSQAEGGRARAARALRRQGAASRSEANVAFGKELKGLRHDAEPLRELGIPPRLAKEWGVGLCARGLMRGRVAFPVRSADGTLMAYAGLSLAPRDPEGRWKFPSGFRRGLELFAIDRIRQAPGMLQRAQEEGLVLAAEPQGAMLLQEQGLPAVSPMGADLGEAQLAMLLDPGINPTARLSLEDAPERRAWAAALIRRAWVRYLGDA